MKIQHVSGASCYIVNHMHARTRTPTQTRARIHKAAENEITKIRQLLKTVDAVWTEQQK